MKNSLTRLLQMHRNRKRFSRVTHSQLTSSASGLNNNLSSTLTNLSGLPKAINQQHQLSAEFLEDLKYKILELIQNPDECILGDNAYT